MNILQSIIYGLVSGVSAILPISLLGHQSLINLLFDATPADPLRNLLVHISVVIAVVIGNSTYLDKLRREKNRPKRARRGRTELSQYYYDFRLIKTCIIPMAICFVIIKLFRVSTDNFAVLSVFFLLNGLIIYITEHIAHGNKGSSKLSAFDSVLIGICSALSALPGISRVGVGMSVFVFRGADRSKAFDWITALTIPFFAILIIFDIVGFFTIGFASVTFIGIMGYLLSGIISFLAAFGSIYLMRFLSVRTSFSVFAFYSWGTALLSFILYLNT